VTVAEINEEEEEQLRDIAIRLGAAMGMHPGDVLDQLKNMLAKDGIFQALNYLDAFPTLDNHKG